MPTTREELLQLLKEAQRNINNLKLPEPQVVSTNDNPPKKIITEDEKQRLKNIQADKVAEELTNVLYPFINDKAHEIAEKIVHERIASLTNRVIDLERRFEGLSSIRNI